MAGYTYIEPNEIYFDSSGGSQLIDLSIDASKIGSGWEIDVPYDLWCEIMIAERYSTNTNISIYAPSNSTPEIRSISLDVKFDGEIVGDLYVEQAAGEISYAYNVNPTSLSFSSNGGTSGVTVTTNYTTSLNIKNDNNWFSVTNNGYTDYVYKFNVVVDPQLLAEERNGTFTISDSYNTVTVNVKQSAMEKWQKVEPSSIELSYNGNDAVVLNLSSNYKSNWKYTLENSEWVSVSSQGDDYNTQLTISATVNRDEERSTTINITKDTFKQVVNIKQGEYLPLNFMLSTNAITYAEKGGTQYIEIYNKSNVKTIETQSNASWCTATINGDTISISTTSYNGVRSGEVIVTAKNDTETLTKTIMIYQLYSKMVGIWKDYYVQSTGATDIIQYNVQKNGELIYTGTLHKNPATGVFNVYINDLVSNYLNSKLEFKDGENYSYIMNDYIGQFNITTTDGTPIAEDYYYNDWSYNNYISNYSKSLVPLADNVKNVLDYRQYFVQSYLNKSTTGTVNVSNGLVSTTLQPAQAVTLVSKNPANGVDLGKQCYTTLTANGTTYKVMNTGKDYCIYYKNAYGGYDWLVVDGISIPSSSIKKSIYRQRTNNSEIGFSKINYHNDITDKIQFNTGFLSDEESAKMKHLYNSTEVYVHNLKTNEISAGIISDTSYTEKTFKNQGYKYFNHQFTIEMSNIKQMK